MRVRTLGLSILFLGILLGGAPQLLWPVSPAPAGDRNIPVLVELFTSEGCSSCPPADSFLLQLNQQAIPGIKIIALGEHVDYWNHLGWSDRFSSAGLSRRQQTYSRHFGLGSVYTPQMVVDGHAQFVGNDKREALQAIAEASRKPRTVVVSIQRPHPDTLAIGVSNAGESSAEVLLAITEDNLATSVEKGENAGRILRHAAVVRELRSIGRLAHGSFSANQSVKLNGNWHRENLHAVVFIQNMGSMEITGAASIPLTD